MEDSALKILGITRTELSDVELRRRDKREYIRRVIADSQPSFGHFMTRVFRFYQGLQESRNTKAKQDTSASLLKEMRALTNTSLQGEDDTLKLALLAYKYSRSIKAEDKEES